MIAQRKQQLGKFMGFWENIRSWFFREESKQMEREANRSAEVPLLPEQAEEVVKPVKAPLRFKVYIQRDGHSFLQEFIWDQDKPMDVSNEEDIERVEGIILQEYGECYELEDKSVKVVGHGKAVMFVAELKNLRKGGIYTKPKPGSQSMGYGD